MVRELASLITFRLFALCISAVINTHNEQWKPRKGGVCVANHTTPADAVILSTETAFSLVEICELIVETRESLMFGFCIYIVRTRFSFHIRASYGCLFTENTNAIWQ